ncbi:MAG: hypothetical protein LBV44_02775 [Methylobacillus sp.]|jgi:hypothetical protein|nr:hypothetical protein [Methylobacillus sp.]
MKLDLYIAFKAAGVSDATAKAAVEALDGMVDERCRMHDAERLAARADHQPLFDQATASDTHATRAAIVKAKTEIIRWTIGSAIVSAGMCAAIITLFR